MNNPNEIEQTILGSILLDNNLMTEAIGEGVMKPMFFSIPNQELWTVFNRLYQERTTIDPSTIVAAYQNNLMDLGGVEYIGKLIASIATLKGFKDHIKILIKRYQQRKIMELGSFIQQDSQLEPDEVISEIQQRTLDILKLSANEVNDKESRYMNHIEHKYNVKYGKVDSAYLTGFKYLDERLGGFKKGNFITIVSGSGVGKTTLAINMAYLMAMKGIKSTYYSVEMTEGELLDKITSSALEIDYKKISSSSLDENEMRRVETFTLGLLQVPLDIIQDVTTTEELLNDIMYRVLSGTTEVVFVDYLQLYCESSKGNNLSEKLGDLTINLKKLSQRNNIVIIALAQTNRVANARVKEDAAESFILSEQDIQDSARIFQNSNIVLGVARNTLLDDEDKRKALVDKKMLSYNSLDLAVNPELMLVQVMKNRSGSIGKVGLRYKGKYSKVENFR